MFATIALLVCSFEKSAELSRIMKTSITLPLLVLLLSATVVPAQNASANAAPAPDKTQTNLSNHQGESAFEESANKALQAMKKRADELHVQGVAVVACLEGEPVQSWSSKMLVVGKAKEAPSKDNAGANLVAIAYSKASEMADTFKNSGSGVRPPMNGEFGWPGGLILKNNGKALIAAFSGASGEDDVKVSRAGLDVLAGR